MRTFTSAIALVIAIAVAVVVIFAAGSDGPARAALGGPVIIGGDDLTDHGNCGGPGPLEGWLYMQKALENIEPNVTRANDGSIAALGSLEGGGGAGEALDCAATAAGFAVTYYEGEEAIGQFFTDLAGGTATPAIIWISGDGAGNDLSDDDDGDAFVDDEAAVLTTNALAIANFVNSGGGLLSHGVEYGWLFSILPGASTVEGGSSDDLYLTADGTAAFPGLTVADINAGPWHNHFEGDFGGLKVLVRSSDIADAQSNDAAVILGGAQVQILPEGPFGAASCSDQIDNDADTLVDDADPDCAPPATATPTPSPEPTASPTPTEVAVVTELPETGAAPSGDSGLPWLAIAAGALAIASGGLVLAVRTRRVL